MLRVENHFRVFIGAADAVASTAAGCAARQNAAGERRALVGAGREGDHLRGRVLDLARVPLGYSESRGG